MVSAPSSQPSDDDTTTLLEGEGETSLSFHRLFALTPFKINIIAGAGSGVVNSLLCSPLDVAKLRQQLQGAYLPPSQRYNGVISTLRIIYQEEGLRGWFRGIRPSLMTLPLFWAIYFPSYEMAKEKLGSAGMTGPLAHCASAMVGGLMSDVVTNPLWVVRTRMVGEIYHLDVVPSNNPSVFAYMRRICHNEGCRALYRGLTASFLGLTHVGLQFPIYEKLKEIARDVQLHGFRNALFPNSSTPPLKGGESPTTGEGSADEIQNGSEFGRIVGLIFASAFSKAIASSITYPHEVLRSRMQDSRESLGLVKTTKQIIASEGIGGLFRGLKVNLARVLPSCVTVFVSFEIISKHLSKHFEATDAITNRKEYVIDKKVK
eukprot:m.139699 g.139699  ORF g.139699 m.139699 type:complete len:375 (-) comp23838_c0_seq1:61-1185(-)